MQMRKYFIYFITIQCSSTTKLILRGLCDVWVENINSILLPVYKFFTADKKTGKPPSFLTDSVFCFFLFFNAKALYIWGRHAWCGCHRFVPLLPVLCVKVQFCKEGLFSSPHLSLELQLMWLVFGPPDGRVCIVTWAGGHPTPTSQRGPTRTCTKNNKKEKHWIEELFMFLLASLPILGLQCNELSPFNTEPLHGNGRPPLIFI